MRKTLLASVLLVEMLTAWQAEARQCWRLDSSETRGCYVGEISPDEFVQAARDTSTFDVPPQVDVERGVDGNVTAVTVTASKRGAETSFLWTTTWFLCDAMKHDFRKKEKSTIITAHPLSQRRARLHRRPVGVPAVMGIDAGLLLAGHRRVAIDPGAILHLFSGERDGDATGFGIWQAFEG